MVSHFQHLDLRLPHAKERTHVFSTSLVRTAQIAPSPKAWWHSTASVNQMPNETEVLTMPQDYPVGQKAIIRAPLWEWGPSLHHRLCVSRGSPPRRHGTTTSRHSHSNCAPPSDQEPMVGARSSSGSAVHTTPWGLSPSADGAARRHGHFPEQWSLPGGQPTQQAAFL